VGRDRNYKQFSKRQLKLDQRLETTRVHCR
jgi:hypothetical protein